MAPNINNPGGVKNDPDEIRDGVVSDATRFPGGFIDQQITEAGAAVQIVGQFQLNNALFNQSFDVSSQAPNAAGLAFKPDGGQLYVVGSISDKVHQYSLSTNFDVSTASFVRSFDVSAQTGASTGLEFKPDGSQLYVLGRSNDEVHQYGLSTAFDISTASFSQSFSVSAQAPIPQGLTLKPDGGQLYVADESNADVFQYSLSTAFDISTASFNQSFDVSSQETKPKALALKPDGSQLYVAGQSSEAAHQYSLSTDFDVSTASFRQSLSISSQDPVPQALVFGSDGSQLYVIGGLNTDVFQYAVGFVGAELG